MITPGTASASVAEAVLFYGEKRYPYDKLGGNKNLNHEKTFP